MSSTLSMRVFLRSQKPLQNLSTRCATAAFLRPYKQLSISTQTSPLVPRTCSGLVAVPPRRALASKAVIPDSSGSSSSDERGELPMLDDEALAALFDNAMPKAEIGALRFLQRYPEYDGRGVKICIFDTGVDPGAAGLQVTTDGKPKIIDIIDCTGSGDVDTSRVERADPADGCIAGASGRRLRPNPAWANPTGEWRVGCKHVYGLVSRGLVSRLKEERKRKWEEAQRGALAGAVADLARFDKDTPASKLSSDPEAKKARAELEGRVALLRDLAKNYEDPGPLIDCVVWHDGAAWRAALDTAELHAPGSGRGALADFAPLTNYRDEHKYGTFSELDCCNFALNILDGGALLSIVADCGAHGTHVAGITAAHTPGEPGSNGIAPGAQIISCKIGDTRLGSMETGTAVVRGLVAARQHGAHLVNMSYGEPTTTPNAGRFIELAAELVRRHGTVFVASAGNAGPALSTVGAPGGTSSALFGVGAYVSPELAAAGHSALQAPAAGLQYNWSSRGPAADGDTGVAFSAPGGAIAPVPQWTQQRRQLMNGTSMSSPNAAGGIALLLSGLLATRGSAPPPHALRRALENTALPLGGGAPDAVLTYGRGLIQIDAAWDYLDQEGAAAVPSPASPVSPAAAPAPTPWYEVETACGEGRGARGRGVYMREPAEAARPRAYRVTVTPRFHEDAATSARLDVEERLVLEATVPWVTAPSALMVHHAGRSFEVLVDPTALPPGLHYGEVLAYQVAARGRGPLFRLPVTVVKPLQVPPAGSVGPTPAPALGVPAPALQDLADGTPLAPAPLAAPAPAAGSLGGGVGALSLGPLSFMPGEEFRSFVAVPPGATWAELSLRAAPFDTPKLFLLRATQLRPEASYRAHEMRSQVTLSGGSEHAASWAVQGGATMELTLAQFWTSAGRGGLEQVELSFYGVAAAADGTGPSHAGCELALQGAEGAKKVLISAPAWCRPVRCKPEAKLTTLHIPLRPTEATLEPLTADRDALTDGRVAYRLLLTYKTTVAEGGKYKPVVPLINKQIYDSPLEAQLLLAHDGASRQLLGVQDAGPEALTLRRGQELLLRLALRHSSAELLDKMRGLPLVLKRKLEGGGVALPLYGSRRDAVAALGGGGTTAGELVLRPGDSAPLWLGPLPEDKLPKDATQGRLLTGHLTLGQLQRGGGAAPHRFSVSYLVGPPAANGAANGGGAKEDAEDKVPEARLQEAVRDAQIKVLKDLKLSDPAQAALYGTLSGQLRAEHPAHLPLLLELLRKADGREPAVRATTGGLAAVVAAADDVISAVDAPALAAFLGVKAGEDTPEYRRTKRDMDERKAALVEALSRKAAALMEAEEVEAKAAAAALAALAAALTEAAAAAAAAAATVDSAPAGDEAPALTGSGGPDVADAAAGAKPGPAPAAVAAAEGPAVGADAVAAAMQELRKWADTAAEPAHLLLHAKAEARAKRYVSALRALEKLLADDKAPPPAATRKEVSELKARLYRSLGWGHWAAQEEALQAVRFPKELAIM